MSEPDKLLLAASKTDDLSESARMERDFEALFRYMDAGIPVPGVAESTLELVRKVAAMPPDTTPVEVWAARLACDLAKFQD